ncbi:MAG TPA: S24 family peptidase [Noviherbaspirillum sp.]|nr:S24 family peptidase [Noviherbaspirillum sp.]
MLRENANTVLNNILFSSLKMPPMHDTMRRLYRAAEQIREVKGPAALARLLNVSAQTVHNWESRGVSRAGLLAAQERIGCNATWLESGVGDMVRATIAIESAPPGRADSIEIVQYKEVMGSMGNGLVLRDQPGEIQSWRVSSEWVQKNVPHNTGVQNLCIVTGFGPSMRPLFNPGDPLLVDRGVTKADRDAIYFFRVGDEGFIKHLQRVPGTGLVAISENKIYKDWVITPDMDFEVFGLVLKVWRGEDF